jgi:hypothetical protein
MIHSRLADWLLACAVAPDERRALLGDLVEEYAIRRGDTSRVAASCWYGTQLLRSIPWLLWIPVRRSGLMATIGVTLVACAAQAAVELLTARVLPRVVDVTARGYLPVALAVVVGSLVVVSYVASRVRPGAGTLLGLIVIVTMLARVLHSGMTGVDLSTALEGMCASSAAFVGSALAVNAPHSPNAE